MKITSIDNTQLRNEEHYQFQTDFKGLVEKKHPCCIEYCYAFTAYSVLPDMYKWPKVGVRRCEQKLKRLIKSDLLSLPTNPTSVGSGFTSIATDAKMINTDRKPIASVLISVETDAKTINTD